MGMGRREDLLGLGAAGARKVRARECAHESVIGSHTAGNEGEQRGPKPSGASGRGHCGLAH